MARVAGRWEQREFRSGESLELMQLRLTLSIDELYAGIQLDPS